MKAIVLTDYGAPARTTTRPRRCRAGGILPEMLVAESEQGSRPIRSRVPTEPSALLDHAFTEHAVVATALVGERGR